MLNGDGKSCSYKTKERSLSADVTDDEVQKQSDKRKEQCDKPHTRRWKRSRTLYRSRHYNLHSLRKQDYENDGKEKFNGDSKTCNSKEKPSKTYNRTKKTSDSTIISKLSNQSKKPVKFRDSIAGVENADRRVIYRIRRKYSKHTESKTKTEQDKCNENMKRGARNGGDIELRKSNSCKEKIDKQINSKHTSRDKISHTRIRTKESKCSTKKSTEKIRNSNSTVDTGTVDSTKNNSLWGLKYPRFTTYGNRKFWCLTGHEKEKLKRKIEELRSDSGKRRIENKKEQLRSNKKEPISSSSNSIGSSSEHEYNQRERSRKEREYPAKKEKYMKEPKWETNESLDDESTLCEEEVNDTDWRHGQIEEIKREAREKCDMGHELKELKSMKQTQRENKKRRREYTKKCKLNAKKAIRQFKLDEKQRRQRVKQQLKIDKKKAKREDKELKQCRKHTMKCMKKKEKMKRIQKQVKLKLLMNRLQAKCKAVKFGKVPSSSDK